MSTVSGRGAGLVLIADDTADTRDLYGLCLSTAGFAVELAADGLRAVDGAIASQPDVIVMDLSMPGLDGITATRRLRAHPSTRHIPVILLTAYPHAARERGTQGIDLLLAKPCLPDDLEQHIRQLVADGGRRGGALPAPPTVPAAGEVPRSLGRVLIVDDEPGVADMLQDVVSTLGYKAETAPDGVAALRLIPVFQPDVVLLDVMMPKLPGGEVLKILRDQHPSIPVVMVTANQDEAFARQLLRAGALDYVRKPLDFDLLGRILLAALGVTGKPAVAAPWAGGQQEDHPASS